MLIRKCLNIAVTTVEIGFTPGARGTFTDSRQQRLVLSGGFRFLHGSEPPEHIIGLTADDVEKLPLELGGDRTAAAGPDLNPVN